MSSFSDYVSDRASYYAGGGGGQQQQQQPAQWNQGGVPIQGGNFGQFVDYYRQIQEANAAAQLPMQGQYQQYAASYGSQQNPYTWWQQESRQDDEERRGFRMDGGTQGLYNGKYRDANVLDTLAIEAGKAGEFWNNLPGNIASIRGGEDAKKDWTFDANQFDLSNGLDWDDLKQVRNFGASLPGMMIGGLFEGAEKGYEALSGAPVQEYREKAGGGYEIADYELDATQRAAAGLDAAINIAGTAFGGTGRVAGSIAKAAAGKAAKEFAEGGSRAAVMNAAEKANKWARRAKNSEMMAQGMIERALTEGGKKKLGTAAQIGSDMAQEAGEEFVQSYADDIRMKNLNEDSLDRAMTGAAWGAVGGGLWSGGVKAITAVANRGKQQDSALNPGQDSTRDAYTFKDDWSGDLRSRQGNFMSAEAKEYVENLYAETRKIDGSDVSKMALGDPDMLLDEIDISDESVRRSFERGDASAQILAEDLGVTVDYLETIIYSPETFNFATTADALNDALSKKGGLLNVVVGRTPATEKGAFRAQVRQFTHGSTASVHPAVFGMIGGDVDGDTDGIYFGADRFKVMGYPSEMIGQPEGGSGFEQWYLGMSDAYKDNPDELKKALDPILGQYGRKIKDASGKEVSLTDYYTGRLANAMSEVVDGEKQAKVASVFMDMRRDIDESKRMFQARNPQAQEPMGGRRAVNMVFNGLTNSESNTMFKIKEDVNARFTNNVYQAFEQVNQEILDKGGKPIPRESIDSFLKRGTLGDATTHAEIYDHLALVLSALGYKQNVAFRQYGQIYYSSLRQKSDFGEIISDARRFTSDKSILDAFIRAEFGMSSLGVSPTHAIEGMLDSFTLVKTLDDAGLLDKRIESAEDLKTLQDTFLSVYNEYVDVYTEAKKRETNAGRMWPPEAVPRVKLESVNDPRFIDTFNRIFGHVPVTQIFDTRFMTNDMAGMTWSELIESTYRNKGGFDQVMIGYSDPEIQEFFDKIGANYGKMKERMSKRIKDLIINMNTAPIQRQLEQTPGDFSNTLNSALDYISMYGNVFGPEMAVKGNALDPTATIDNRLIGMLYSENPDERLNASVTYMLHTQFADIMADLKSDDKDVAQSARNRLHAASQISPLHQVIALELAEDGESDFLNYLTDLDNTFSQKQDFFDQSIGSMFADADLFIDSMMTEHSEFDLSSVSERIRKAESYVVKAEQSLYTDARSQMSKVTERLRNKSLDQDEYKAFIERGARLSNSQMDMNIFGAQIYEAAIISHPIVEKGTNNAAAGLNIAQLENIVNGGLVSYQEVLWGLRQGTVSMNTFQSNRFLLTRCLTDPEFKIVVEDERTGRNREMTQQVLFASYGIELNGNPPSGMQYALLLEQCPQLVDWITAFQPKPGISADAKNPQVSPAKSMSHIDSLNQFLTSVKGTAQKRGPDGEAIDPQVYQKVNDGLSALSVRLMNDPRYKGYLVTCIADDLEKGIDAEFLTRKAARIHDQITRAIYSRALNPEGGTASIDASFDWKRGIHRRADRDLLNAFNYAADMVGFMASEARAKENVFRAQERMFNDRNFLTLVSAVASGEMADQDLVNRYRNSFGEFIDSSSTAANDAKRRMQSEVDKVRGIFAALAGVRSTRSAEPVSEEAVRLGTQMLIEARSERLGGKQLDPGEMARIADSLDNLRRLYDSTDFEIQPQGEYLLDLDEDFSDIDTLYKKMAFLHEETGQPIPPNYREWLDEEYINGTGDRRAFQRRWANEVVKNSLKQIEMIADTQVNPDMYDFEVDMYDFVDDVLNGEESARSFLESEGLLPQTQVEEARSVLSAFGPSTMPQPTVTSKVAQVIATNLRIADDSGGAALYVNNNGGQVKQHYGYGHLPEYSYTIPSPSSNPVTGVPYTASEVVEMAKRDPAVLRHRIIVNEGYDPANIKPDDIDTVGSYLDKLVMMGDSPVGYFDPLDNPHGISYSHTPALPNSQFKEWHRTPALVGKIDAAAMEAMVMKAKKVFGAKNRVVNKNPGRWWGDDDYSMDLGTLLDPMAQQDGSAMASLHSMMRGFRSDLADVFNGEFKKGGSLDSLGWGEEQAVLLATHLNPGIKVRVRKADGSVDTLAVDANVIVNEDIAGFLDAIGGQDAVEILSAEPFVVNPKTVSYRIMTAIDSDPNIKDQAAATEKAASKVDDWSDYVFDDLPVSTIMNGIRPLGYASRHGRPIRLSDSTTAPQYVLDVVYEDSAGASVRGVRGDKVKVKHVDVKSGKWKRAVNTARNIGCNDEVPGILRVFPPTRSDMAYSLDEKDFINSNLMDLDKEVNVYYAGGRMNSAGLVLNASDLQEAVNWAARTRNFLVVPKWIIDQYGNGGFTGADKVGETEINIGDNDISCMVINPSKSRMGRVMAGNRPQSYRAPRRKTARVLVDQNNLFKNADASIALTTEGQSLTITPNGWYNIPMHRLFENAKGEKGIASIGDVRGLANALVDSNDNIVENSPSWNLIDFSYYKGDERAAKRAVFEYLVYVKNADRATDSIRRTDMGSGRCMALATNNDGVFAPIILPKTTARVFSFTDLRQVGDDIMIPWDSKMTIGEGVDIEGQPYTYYIKCSASGNESFKGVAKPAKMPNGLGEPSIGFAVGKDKSDMAIHGIISGETESGRSVGREAYFLKEACYRGNFDCLGSRIFTFSQDGQVRLNPYIEDCIMNPSQHPESPWTVGDLIDFLAGNEKPGGGVTAKVANGQLKLSDKAEDNEVIQLVVARCMRYGVDPIHMLTTYVGTPVVGADGSISVDPGTIRFDNDEMNYETALYGLNPDQVLRFYSGMNEKFCPPDTRTSAYDSDGKTPLYLIDGQGNTYMKYTAPNGETVQTYAPVRWTEMEALNESGFTSGHSGQASWSFQQDYMRSYEMGFNDQTFNDTIAYQNFLLKNTDYLSEFARRQAREKSGRNVELNEDNLVRIILDNPVISYSEALHKESVMKMAETHKHARKVVDADGKAMSNPEDDPRVKAQMDKFRALFGPGINFKIVDMWCKNKVGYTYNDGRGVHEVSSKRLAEQMAAVYSDFTEKGVPVACYDTGKSFSGNKFALPHQLQWQIDWAWDHQVKQNGIGFLEKKYGQGDAGKKAFVEAIRKEEKKAEEVIAETIPQTERAKKGRLFEYIEWVYLDRGEKFKNTLYLYNGQYVFDAIASDEKILPVIARTEGWTQEEMDSVKQLISREREQLQRMRDISDDKDMASTAKVTMAPGGSVMNPKYRDAWSVHRVLDNATKLSQAMSFGFNPFVTAANILDRGVHQGMMTAMINGVGKWNVGPWKYSDRSHIPNQDFIEAALQNPTFMKLFAAYREAGFTGEEIMFLSQMSESTDIDAFLESRRQKKGLFQKATDAMIRFGAGGDLFLKNQARIFLNRFCMFADADPEQQFWFKKQDADGTNLFESMILNDPANWFVSVLGGNGNTPSLTIARQALNSAKTGDLAQAHTGAILYGELVRHMPMAKFLTITTVSKFPQFSMNITHRLLNWVLPMSSLYYTFTEHMGNTKIGERLDIEAAGQVHRNLREALYVDVLHLGLSAMAMILMGTAMLQPPDDERRWNNLDEWLFCGFRVGESWWVKDLLGMALPLAAFGKSASLGKPMIPLLTDGVVNACYSNPMMRVNDAVGFLLDPDDSVFAEFDRTDEEYADAPNGAPDLLEKMGVTAGMSTVNWFTQFWTPSVVREIYKNYRAMTPELSYKKVYDRDATGKVLEDETGTQRTTYADAMWRKTARNNPFLFMITDMMDPYPNTVYYDDYELEAMEATSIAGLDDYQMQIKVMQIIDTLQRYDDMDELKKTGFYLDPATKAAVSSQIWDNYYELKSEWNRLNQSGELDRYTLGNGSWEAGNEAYYEIKESFEQLERYWSNFYYDKIKNSYLSEGMQQYNRYGTTYAKDVYGNIYATGFHNAGVLPFISAPGTASDAASTAGYGNDFASVSAVTGLPMQTSEGGAMRALVPVDPDKDEWPDFESWSDDGNGTSYSSIYAARNGNNGSTNSGYVQKSSSGYGSRSYGSGGYRTYPRRSYGGGGYRGGGGSTPNIYAPSVSTSNKAPSRIMTSDRIVNPNLEYLRPDFETKGSREAYRRSDI